MTAHGWKLQPCRRGTTKFRVALAVRSRSVRRGATREVSSKAVKKPTPAPSHAGPLCLRRRHGLSRRERERPKSILKVTIRSSSQLDLRRVTPVRYGIWCRAHRTVLRYSAAAIREATWSLSSAKNRRSSTICSPSISTCLFFTSSSQSPSGFTTTRFHTANLRPVTSLARTPKHGRRHHTRPTPAHCHTPMPTISDRQSTHPPHAPGFAVPQTGWHPPL